MVSVWTLNDYRRNVQCENCIIYYSSNGEMRDAINLRPQTKECGPCSRALLWHTEASRMDVVDGLNIIWP